MHCTGESQADDYNMLQVLFLAVEDGEAERSLCQLAAATRRHFNEVCYDVAFPGKKESV